jgi:lysozyme
MDPKIIDVSSNNGTIDWAKAKSDDVSDAIIRLSLGAGDKDKMAEKYAKDAKAAGIKVSYYHLAYPDKSGGSLENDAKSEANYFTSHFKANLMPAPKWLAVDLEKKADGTDTPLTKDEYLKWLQAFLAQVYANTNIICMIYSNKSYLETHLPTNHALGTVPLWIANYNNVLKPPLPNGWTKYELWQYSEKGTVLGITTNCDLNLLP